MSASISRHTLKGFRVFNQAEYSSAICKSDGLLACEERVTSEVLVECPSDIDGKRLRLQTVPESFNFN